MVRLSSLAFSTFAFVVLSILTSPGASYPSTTFQVVPLPTASRQGGYFSSDAIHLSTWRPTAGRNLTVPK